MRIKLSNAGKRFSREWIFRNANLEFGPSSAYAITGPNGSGKSTMLQCIAGMIQPSEGTILFENEKGNVPPEDSYRYVSFCAPYLELIEEMSLTELLQFHAGFKPFIGGCTIPHIIESIGLERSAGKQVRYYSSGMKQRVKLAQAVFSDVPVVLLDEPCSNFDSKGIDLYRQLVDTWCKHRTVIVSSNDPAEYSFAGEVISVTDFRR